MPLTTPLWDAVSRTALPDPGPAARPERLAVAGRLSVSATGTALDPSLVEVAGSRRGSGSGRAGLGGRIVGFHYGLFSRSAVALQPGRRLNSFIDTGGHR